MNPLQLSSPNAFCLNWSFKSCGQIERLLESLKVTNNTLWLWLNKLFRFKIKTSPFNHFWLNLSHNLSHPINRAPDPVLENSGKLIFGLFLGLENVKMGHYWIWPWINLATQNNLRNSQTDSLTGAPLSVHVSLLPDIDMSGIAVDMFSNDPCMAQEYFNKTANLPFHKSSIFNILGTRWPSGGMKLCSTRNIMALLYFTLILALKSYFRYNSDSCNNQHKLVARNE